MTEPHIIFALGNPGKRYATTRHNAGFLFADYLVQHASYAPFVHKKKFSADCSDNLCNCRKCIIAKPTTFMNHAGIAAHALVDYYHTDPTSLYVVHDDLDLPLGTYKISHSKNAAGHNGVQDIITHLGTKDFTRIRIGIDNRSEEQRANQPGSDYVLDHFTAKEQDILNDVFTNILKEDIIIL